MTIYWVAYWNFLNNKSSIMACLWIYMSCGITSSWNDVSDRNIGQYLMADLCCLSFWDCQPPCILEQNANRTCFHLILNTATYWAPTNCHIVWKLKFHLQCVGVSTINVPQRTKQHYTFSQRGHCDWSTFEYPILMGQIILLKCRVGVTEKFMEVVSMDGHFLSFIVILHHHKLSGLFSSWKNS